MIDDDRPVSPPQTPTQSLSDCPSPSPLPSPSISLRSPLPSPPPETKEVEPESPPIALSALAVDVVNKAIALLSAAPPDQLLVVLVGGVIVLYIVLGKLGLLVIGVVAGAVGHASLSLTHAKREGSAFSVGLHEWLDDRKRADDEKEDDARAVVKTSSTKADFSSLPPETAKAMGELTDAVMRDYVRWWYNPLLPNDENFPASCRNVLTNALLVMYNRIANKRGADTFLLFLMSASNTFIVFLRELAATQESSIEQYMEESPSSAMAQLLDRDLQKRKLRMAAEDVLRSFFGKDVLQCEPVRTFLTEILAGVVLEMTVDKCSQPDWINSWLVYLLEEETQPELLQKIDIGEATSAVDQRQSDKSKRISRAEEEMTKALEEAKSLNKMIVEEEREREQKRMSTNGSSNTIVGSSNGERGSLISENGHRANQLSVPDPVPSPEQTTPQVPPMTSEHLFTSFDQLPRENTLHRAHISLSDLSPPVPSNPYSIVPTEKTMRNKPASAEYLLQIEPASPSMPGWVVVRKFTEFEALHEVLKRIAIVSGAESFRRHHAELPAWRGETMGSLRLHLEGYLNDALHERRLAECEGMKRFLEKDSTPAAPGKMGFAIGKGWPNPASFAKMGQGALDALAKAPQGVAEGGKGLFGGMKKAFTVVQQQQRIDDGASAPPGTKRVLTDPFGDMALDYQSQTRSRPASIMEEQPRRNGFVARTATSSRASSLHRSDTRRSDSMRDSLRDSAGYMQLELSTSEESDCSMSAFSLPPPPSDMPDDYSPVTTTSPVQESPSQALPSTTTTTTTTTTPPPLPPRRQKAAAEPLTTQETQFIVDILFALLTELYTLSSAWTLRLSLLNVAKSILLRPGNASLENIRVVIQETVIDANTKDDAVAALIRQVRENVFPTPEEKERWEHERKELTGEELKEKARRLLVVRGVPEALQKVMGAAAGEEALERVFNALQTVGVARGVVGGVVLEGVRGVCQ